MDDAANDASWLRDEHRMILYALVSLAVVVGGHRSWKEFSKYQENAHRRARIIKLVENSKKESSLATSSHTAAVADESQRNLSTDGRDARSTSRSTLRGQPNAKSDTLIASASTSSVAGGSISKRSKERKKRGRDAVRDSAKEEQDNRTSSGSRSLGPSGSNSTTGKTQLNQQQVAGPSNSNSSASLVSASGSSSTADPDRRGRQRKDTRSKTNATESFDEEVDTPRPRASSTMASVSHLNSSDGRDDSRAFDAPDVDVAYNFPDSDVNGQSIRASASASAVENDRTSNADSVEDRENDADALKPSNSHYTILPSQPPESSNPPRLTASSGRQSRSKSKKRKQQQNTSHFSNSSPSPNLVPLPESRPTSSLSGEFDTSSASASASTGDSRSRGSSIIDEFERKGADNGRDRERRGPPRLTTSLSTPHHPQLSPLRAQGGAFSPGMTCTSMWPHNLNFGLGEAINVNENGMHMNGNGARGHMKKSSTVSISTSASSSLSASISDGSWDFESVSSASPPLNGQNLDGRAVVPPPRLRSKARQAVSASPLPTIARLTKTNGLVGSNHSSPKTPYVNETGSATNSPETLLFPSLNPTPPPNASLTTQIASYRGALEAARTREESYRSELEHFRAEAERLGGESEAAKWQWSEADKEWKKREAELQSHIHNLMHQLNSLSIMSGVASAVPSPTLLPPNLMGPPLMPFVPPPVQSGLSHNNHHSPHRGQSRHRGHPHHANYHPAPIVPSVLGSPFGYPSSTTASSSSSSLFYNMHYPARVPQSSVSVSTHIPRPASASNSHSSSNNSSSGSPILKHHDFTVVPEAPSHARYEYNYSAERAQTEEDDGISEQLAEAILKRPDSLRSPGSSSSIGSYASSNGKAVNGGFSAWLANSSRDTNGEASGIGLAISSTDSGLRLSSGMSSGSVTGIVSDETLISPTGGVNGNANLNGDGNGGNACSGCATDIRVEDDMKGSGDTLKQLQGSDEQNDLDVTSSERPSTEENNGMAMNGHGVGQDILRKGKTSTYGYFDIKIDRDEADTDEDNSYSTDGAKYDDPVNFNGHAQLYYDGEECHTSPTKDT